MSGAIWSDSDCRHKRDWIRSARGWIPIKFAEMQPAYFNDLGLVLEIGRFRQTVRDGNILGDIASLTEVVATVTANGIPREV